MFSPMATKNREPLDAQRPQRNESDEHFGEDPPADGILEDTLATNASGADATSELAAANDRALRLQAEMQNLRNRTAREIADERRYAALPVLRDLLPVVDNIDRAIEAAEKAGEAENLLEGFRLVRQQLMTTLTQHQCEPITADGQPFDPNYHQAILQQPSADVPAGHVMMVTQTGYKLHDRVVRPAQVIVSSGPPA
jgi:molecular chaperone GrpE